MNFTKAIPQQVMTNAQVWLPVTKEFHHQATDNDWKVMPSGIKLFYLTKLKKFYVYISTFAVVQNSGIKIKKN